LIRIVAVDDEPAFIEVLSTYLEELGNFKVKTFTSPELAINKIISGDVDAVITDYRMDEMDGITFIKYVKSQVSDLPFVLLTGVDDRAVIIQALDAGVDFIQFKGDKPSIIFTEIAQKITNAVEKYRAKKEAEEGSRRRELMMQISRDLMSRLSVILSKNEALDATLTAIRDLTGCSSESIHLINDNTKRIELAISHNLPQEQLKRFTFGDLHKVIYTGKSQYFKEEENNDDDEIPITGGQIPIITAGEVIGILSFILDIPNIILPDICDTIELLASQLGNTLIRIKSEELVRQRQEELSELYSVMQELVIVVDMDATILNVNPATSRILGYKEKELEGLPVQIIYPPEIRDDIIFQFMDLTGSGQIINNTYPLLTRFGTKIPVETRGSVGMWRGKNVLFCIAREISERLEAERSLHEYYERIGAILASSTAQIYMKDLEMNYMMGNDPFCYFVKKEPCDIKGRSDLDFFPVSLAEKRQKSDMVVIMENTPFYNIEEEIPGPDGSPLWLISSKVPVHDQNGKVSGLVGTSVDITDLVKTRHELIKRDFILQAVNTVAQALFRSDEWEPIITECLKILGYATEFDQIFILGNNSNEKDRPWELYHEWKFSPLISDKNDMKQFFSLLNPSIGSILEDGSFYLGTRESLQDDLHGLSNVNIPEFILLLPVFLDGMLWGTLGFLNIEKNHSIGKGEIELLMMASEMIGSAISRNQTEELFRKPVERSLVGVYLTQNEKFIYTNPRMSEILGYSRNILEETGISSYIHPDDAGMVLQHHQQVSSMLRTADDYEFRAITSDGRVIIIENLITNFIYQGSPAVIGSIMDITVRKKAEEELRQSLKEKDILLREIHHRVKNNMQIIVSMLRMQSSMIDDPVISSVLRESKNRILSMAIIHEKLYRTDSLVNINLLEYINSLASTLISDFAMDESLITLDVVCDPSIEMTIDAGIPLGLIFNELITNSFKYAFQPDKKGTIGFSVFTTESGNLDITYRDSGKGLPDGFDPEMCDSLGMQLISNLIYQSSGEISFSSDKGAVVKMKIPISEGFIVGGRVNATG